MANDVTGRNEAKLDVLAEMKGVREYIEGSKDGFRVRMRKHNGDWILDMTMFVEDMIDAVKAWYAKEAKNQNVAKNLSALIQYYPYGLLDYLNLAAIG